MTEPDLQPDLPCYAIADLAAPTGQRILFMFHADVTKEQAEARAPSIMKASDYPDRDLQLVRLDPP
jgi:hypothetical protein